MICFEILKETCLFGRTALLEAEDIHAGDENATWHVPPGDSTLCIAIQLPQQLTCPSGMKRRLEFISGQFICCLGSVGRHGGRRGEESHCHHHQTHIREYVAELLLCECVVSGDRVHRVRQIGCIRALRFDISLDACFLLLARKGQGQSELSAGHFSRAEVPQLAF